MSTDIYAWHNTPKIPEFTQPFFNDHDINMHDEEINILPKT